MTLDDLLKIPYRDNGRTVDGCDCYGGVRLARVALFGADLMPDYTSVDGSDKKAMTAAMLSESAGYQMVSRKPGAIATAWRGRLCIHVGLVVAVDGQQMILEWDTDSVYPRLIFPALFERRFTQVLYYAD